MAMMVMISVIVSAGCAHFLADTEFGKSKQAYDAWKEINPNNLTDAQRARLAEAEAVNWTAPENAVLVQRFFWIDAETLSVRDKVWLGECMLDFKQAAVAGDVSGG